MISAIQNNLVGSTDKPPVPPLPANLNFMDIFDGATRAATQGVDPASAPVASAATVQTAVAAASIPSAAIPAPNTSTAQTATSAAPANSGDPNVQTWLNSYYTEMSATNPAVSATSADISYQPAAGAGSYYTADSIIGPDQVYTQAIYNQNGNAFASMTGENAANLTSQLPGIPDATAQQEFDTLLSNENANRLATGSAIDTSAYWSDPGPVTVNGHTYTSQELGYAGPCQSSGPQPIYLSANEQIAGTNTFCVPGYTGTVTGLQPGRYYTLQQLEQAGLPSGQPDAQSHPGSWSMTQSS